MRWSYKTVHYELKKEGLLGNAFLDESEIELSLNEYGKGGWELVSILETQEGLIAVFKQQLDFGRQTMNNSEEDHQSVVHQQKKEQMNVERNFSKLHKKDEKIESQAVAIDECEIVVDDQDEADELPSIKGDIGSIRIR